MRVSDEDRQRTIDELRRHCAAGRIDVDEYADRIERAIGASTLEELDRVLGDLPFMRIADPAGSRPSDRKLGLVARLGASVTILVSVVLVVVGVVLVILGAWAWAAVLIAGWLIGLAQGHLSGRRR